MAIKRATSHENINPFYKYFKKFVKAISSGKKSSIRPTEFHTPTMPQETKVNSFTQEPKMPTTTKIAWEENSQKSGFGMRSSRFSTPNLPTILEEPVLLQKTMPRMVSDSNYSNAMRAYTKSSLPYNVKISHYQNKADGFMKDALNNTTEPKEREWLYKQALESAEKAASFGSKDSTKFIQTHMQNGLKDISGQYLIKPDYTRGKLWSEVTRQIELLEKPENSHVLATIEKNGDRYSILQATKIAAFIHISSIIHDSLGPTDKIHTKKISSYYSEVANSTAVKPTGGNINHEMWAMYNTKNNQVTKL